MDEEKLKEDDWMKEISRSIGEQIEKDEESLPTDETEMKDKDISIDKNAIKDGNVTVKNKNKELNMPIVDESTKVENPASEEFDVNNIPVEDMKEDSKSESNAEDVKEGNESESNVEDANAEAEENKDEYSDMPQITLDDDILNGTEEPGALESYLESVQGDEGKRKKWSWKKKLLVVLCVLGVLAASLCAVVYAMLDRIHTERPEDIKRVESELTPSEIAKQEETMEKQQFDDVIEKQVVNILLIGEEAMADDLGRSDSMMIATLNTVEKSLKLTSLMRDIYVQIPGYADNKLNAAYHNGGGVLLTETIEQNFGIEIDGYVRVDFSAFETIVDKLGGVDIELTSDEAHYLNTTNYISKKANRNVKPGQNTMNGNQALGYCRVRYQSASNGEANDFGRTYRQRTVLKAIFDKYKHQNVVSMISIATDLLHNVTTNMTKSEMISYVTTAASFGTMELETFRVPIDNTYYGDKINGKSVLVVEKDTNKVALRKFIYAGIDDADIEVNSGDTEDERYFSYLWTD